MSEELKACSYCGKQPQGNNWHTYGRNPKDEMRYFCANHDCPNGFHKVLTLEEWNTRPLEDTLNSELAVAQAEVERLREAVDFVLFNLDPSNTTEDIETIRAEMKRVKAAEGGAQ